MSILWAEPEYPPMRVLRLTLSVVTIPHPNAMPVDFVAVVSSHLRLTVAESAMMMELELEPGACVMRCVSHETPIAHAVSFTGLQSRGPDCKVYGFNPSLSAQALVSAVTFVSDGSILVDAVVTSTSLDEPSWLWLRRGARDASALASLVSTVGVWMGTRSLGHAVVGHGDLSCCILRSSVSAAAKRNKWSPQMLRVVCDAE